MAGSAGDQIDQCGISLSLALAASLMTAASLTVLSLDTGVVHATGLQQRNAVMAEGWWWLVQSVSTNTPEALASLGTFLRYKRVLRPPCPWNG